MPDLIANIGMFAWVLIVGIFIGRYSILESTEYRMGKRIVQNIQSTLDTRSLVGDYDLRIETGMKWMAMGHEWEIVVHQKPKEDM